jgi:hypothetical protein
VMACSALKRSYRRCCAPGPPASPHLSARRSGCWRRASRSAGSLHAALTPWRASWRRSSARARRSAWAYNVRLGPNEIVTAVIERIATQGGAISAQCP